MTNLLVFIVKRFAPVHASVFQGLYFMCMAFLQELYKKFETFLQELYKKFETTYFYFLIICNTFF